jgi:hypothetical protein
MASALIVQHRTAEADIEPADGDGQEADAQRTGDVYRTGKLWRRNGTSSYTVWVSPSTIR